MRVYLFDIDGTLIVSGGAGRAALKEAMEVAFEIPLRHDIDLHGRTDRWIAKQLLEQHGLPNTNDNWQSLREAYLQLLPKTLHQGQGSVLPGVTDLLQHLEDDVEAAVGLLTGNVRQGADIKLTHFALDGFVTSKCFGGYGDIHDCRNRVAADALTSVREVLGEVRPEDVWVIGDTPRDVDCARSIGAKAAAVATGGYTVAQLTERQPDVVLEDLVRPERLLGE